ncbi:hypothetical protein [Paracoccus sanguinis]|nr:hypothetical protein [Paracoccus sanguinis]
MRALEIAGWAVGGPPDIELDGYWGVCPEVGRRPAVLPSQKLAGGTA